MTILAQDRVQQDQHQMHRLHRDPKSYSGALEDPKRDLYQKLQKVIMALGLKPGEVIDALIFMGDALECQSLVGARGYARNFILLPGSREDKPFLCTFQPGAVARFGVRDERRQSLTAPSRLP